VQHSHADGKGGPCRCYLKLSISYVPTPDMMVRLHIEILSVDIAVALPPCSVSVLSAIMSIYSGPTFGILINQVNCCSLQTPEQKES
jgi:hypothetical protein